MPQDRDGLKKEKLKMLDMVLSLRSADTMIKALETLDRMLIDLKAYTRKVNGQTSESLLCTILNSFDLESAAPILKTLDRLKYPFAQDPGQRKKEWLSNKVTIKVASEIALEKGYKSTAAMLYRKGCVPIPVEESPDEGIAESAHTDTPHQLNASNDQALLKRPKPVDKLPTIWELNESLPDSESDSQSQSGSENYSPKSPSQYSLGSAISGVTIVEMPPQRRSVKSWVDWICCRSSPITQDYTELEPTGRS